MEVVYKSNYFDSSNGFSIAHLDITTENRVPLPFTETGYRSHFFHASEIEEFEKDGNLYVRFKVHPKQKKPGFYLPAEAKVIDIRDVKSSSGKSTMRTVISANIRLLDQTVAVELTLADRSEMGFRMLLGREAFRGRFLVDAGNSFYGGKPKRKSKQNPSGLSSS